MAMPEVPSIKEIKKMIENDIESKIGQEIPALPLAFFRVLAGALAPVIYLLYQSIIWVYKQIFPQSADYESLVMHGDIVGLEPVSAVQAKILCDVPGTGAAVSAGELFFYEPTGIVYKVLTTKNIVSGVANDVPMLAQTSGDIGTVANGEELISVNSTIGLDGTAMVVSTERPGADEESRSNFANRVGKRFKTRYVNGSAPGYVLNGLETPNFNWVGSYADDSIPGKIIIYGRVDNQTDGIPTTAQLNELRQYLEFDPQTGQSVRKPLSDVIECRPISLREFDLTIFSTSVQADLKAKIEEEINNFVATLEPFITGISDVRKNIITNTDVASVADSVATVNGEKVTSVSMQDVVTGLIETNYTLYGGEFIKIRSFSYVEVPS